jgi:hypothetical protein
MMNDAAAALKQEVADCINSESRLMASTISVHKGNSHSDTMAVFCRHRPDELLTDEYRAVVVEFYIDDGGNVGPHPPVPIR